MRDHPVIKVTLIFIAGIVSANIISINIYFVGLIFAISVVSFFISGKIQTKNFYIFLTALLVSIIIFSIGNFLACSNQHIISPYLKDIDRVANTSVAGKIDKIDLIRKEELIIYLAIDSMYSEEFFIKDKIYLLCKFSMEASTLRAFYDKLKPGNQILATGFFYKGRDQRNPGEFDYNAYLNSKGIAGILKITEQSSVKIISEEFDLLENGLHQTRKVIDEQLIKFQSLETFSLLRGLLLADRGEINYETKTHFINAGVVHVLAVSGLNVGFIVLIFLLSFGRLNLFVRSGITIAGLLFYMILTGSPASVVRATLMAVVIIIAYLSNRSNNLINSIALAALVILIIDPNQLYDAGFQLSFSAVISMALLYPGIETLIEKYTTNNKIIRYFFLMIGLSLSAQIGTVPFTFYYFSKFSTISLLANLIVIPSIGVITGIGIFTLIISLILPSAAIYFASANDLITSLLFKLINYSGSLDFSYISINNYSLFDFFIFYLFVMLLVFSYKRMQHTIPKVLLVPLIIINIYLFSNLDDKELLPDNYLSIMMIDVGQGDSFLIKFPNGKTALVDAGNTTITYDNGERVIIPLLKYLGIEKINFGLVSHIDNDHYGGFVALVLDGLIGEIYKPALDTSLNKDVLFEEFLRERKVPVHYYSERKMEIGNTVLYFFYDKKNDNIAGGSTNNHSGIFKLVYGETSFLFTGDVEKNVEKIYTEKYRNFLDSDVLKAGHHGSKTSSSDEFLSYVTPKYSLISAGFKNKFGHPAYEVIQRLEKYGSKIYRTDLQKAVLLRSDGKQVKVIKW
jgi:competence protein ComEC